MFLNPSKVKECVETCLKARLVPFIQGSPGVGKSEIVKQIADEYGLKLIDCRLSTMEPVDLNGIPWIQEGKAKFNPYDIFPLESTPIPQGYQGFLLFLDEFNSASRATQAAAYRVVLDREIGNHKLHPNCFVVAAGDKASDNAIVNRLSTAMLSRVIHFNMEVNFEDWRDNYAIPQGIDERIIAYLSMFPHKLMEFDPEREDQTFASPRTWSFASKLIKANRDIVNKDIIPLLAGAITFEHASAFVQFCKIYDDLITIDDIVANPDIEPPHDSATTWALIIHLINRTNDENYKAVFKFINKVSATFRVVYCRSIPVKHPNLVHDSEFIKCMQEMINYYGDLSECLGTKS